MKQLLRLSFLILLFELNFGFSYATVNNLGVEKTNLQRISLVAPAKNLLSAITVTNGTLDSIFNSTTYINSLHPTVNSVSLALTANDPAAVITVGTQTGIGTMNLTVDNTNSMWESGILQAKPEKWKDGHINGLRGRGNVEVDISWAGSKLK
jgi:hypothetical protein